MRRNDRFPDLDPEAPDVPPGLLPKIGVTYGCGSAECSRCYEPDRSEKAVKEERWLAAIKNAIEVT